MKNLSKVSILAALLLAAFAIQTNIHAQNEPIVGGYGEVSARSADAKRNAGFAIGARAKRMGQTITLVKILKAEQQVVAGMNFKICMRVRINRRVSVITAVVFRNLRNRRSLSSWTPGGCS